MQPVGSKRLSNLILFLGVIVLFSVTSLVAVNAAYSVKDDIYSGVKVGDIDVGGLSLSQAEQKIADAFHARTEQPPLTLVFKKQSWPVTAEQIELVIDPGKLAQQAYEVGRTGNIIQRLQERYLAANKGHVIPLTLSYNYDKLHSIIIGIARDIDREPTSAILRQVGRTMEVTPETTGQKVDIARTLAEVTNQLNMKLQLTLPVAVQEAKPAITTRDLEGIDGVIASYSTQFNPGDQNRSQNIYLAAKNINNVLVKQGETFSFNAYVGPRLAQYGYKEAPVFVDGKLLPDWGGGVCQVSSTLYNAVLLADMSIEERTPHFRPPGYVPLGQDATVADNLLDFRFKNTTSHNIYIAAEIAQNQLTVSVYGKLSASPPEIQVVAADRKVLEPNTIIKQDPQLDLGKEVVEVEGQKGFQVTTYRVKYQNGKEVGRELLAADEYSPEDKVVRVGNKARQAK